MQAATARATHPVTLSDVQLECVQQALSHEMIRATARARDERLSDTARDAERELLHVMGELVTQLRRTAAA